MHNLRALGAKIWEVMYQQDISKGELSELIKLDWFTLGCILNGYLFMSGKDLTNISKALDYPADKFFECSFDTYNKYVFKGKLKSEEDLEWADAILDRVEEVIHEIRCMDLEDRKKEVQKLEKRIEQLERKVKEYESNIVKS